ncbi:MAG: hypothetical protein IJ020_02230, partial [Bacteroidaceae bacterium]|nr:hypothetical protein [Bacteroidaceae bacterium]
GAFHRVSMCFTICNFAGIEVLAISFNVAVKHIETGFVCQFGRRHVPLPSVLKVNKWRLSAAALRNAAADFNFRGRYNISRNINHKTTKTERLPANKT